MQHSKISRAIEFVLLFYALPIFIYVEPFMLPRIPILLLVTVYAAVILKRDGSFDNGLFWNFEGLRKSYKRILLRIAIVCVFLFIIAYVFWGGLLFEFLTRRFWFWLLVIFLYPVFSAYPQELLYRVFFFHRYAPLFGKPRLMIFMSAVSFAFLHIIYRNWVAVTFTFFGGIVFALSYFRNRSVAGVSIEHAVYGDVIFTLGLGGFFYNG